MGNKTEWAFDFGDEVECTITGFRGKVISKLIWQTGCKQYCVKPPVDKDGKMRDGEYVDEFNLILVGHEDICNGPKRGGLMADMPSEKYQG